MKDNLFDPPKETAEEPPVVARPNPLVLAVSGLVGVIIAAAIWGVVLFVTLNLIGGLDLSLRELAGGGALLTALILGVRNTVQSLFRT